MNKSGPVSKYNRKININYTHFESIDTVIAISI